VKNVLHVLFSAILLNKSERMRGWRVTRMQQCPCKIETVGRVVFPVSYTASALGLITNLAMLFSGFVITH
jgi:hypothetical protein